MSKLILIIDEKGNEVKRFVSGHTSYNEGMCFYMNHSSGDEIRDDALAFYPVYTSGKCKGPVAFKKDGTLVLSNELFVTIKSQNGYLQDGKKNVRVNLPCLIIEYTKEKIYDYRLVELLKAAMERDIGHIHTLENLSQKFAELCLLWEDLQTNEYLSIEVTKRPMLYDHLSIQTFYIGSSNELNKVIEHFNFPEGETSFNFKTEIKNLKETPFVYNAQAMGWV